MPRRHPEAPEPVNDVPYVDLSRERQPRLICGVADRITGLQLGADHCMVKPFSPKELEARIRCVLRRSERPGLQGRRSHSVTGMEFSLLELLVRRAGMAIPRLE
jgi:CheY-like chemotaxis protein